MYARCKIRAFNFMDPPNSPPGVAEDVGYRGQTGCGGDHLVLQCGKLRKLSLSERRRALETSGLCMFYLRHPADTECFDQGGCTKSACVHPGWKGRHAVGVHELLGGEDASVNLVTEEGHRMEGDEDLYVNIARVGQEEDGWQEPDDSWLELDGGESEEEAGAYCVSACLRKDDSGLEDELEYFMMSRPLRKRKRLRRTGGGPQNLRDQNLRRRTRKRTSISLTCLWAASKPGVMTQN